MKFKILRILAIIIPLCLVGFWFFRQGSAKKGKEVHFKPERGDFEVPVTVQGELEAKNSIEILGPARIRKLGISQMKISELVDEGTVVQKGDFVAELDATEIMAKLKESEINLQKFESQVTQARLDCTLTLSQSRDDLVNLKYAMEQRKLEKEESVFEAPSARRAAEIEYEKSSRAFDQAKLNYSTKVLQSEAKMKEVTADYNKEQQKYEELHEILGEFHIMAPENGMVIYAREWGGGKKIAAGSTVNSWDPTVATLPDLSMMQSKTYVNEVDIQKVKKGQEVIIGLDADPGKKLKGKVVQVANIGQEQSGSDSKVFEVIIEVETKDPTLRPAMTSSNRIIINRIPNVVFIPQDAIIWEDTLPYVMKVTGSTTTKTKVKLGATNEDKVVVLSGITENDEIVFLKTEEETEEKK